MTKLVYEVVRRAEDLGRIANEIASADVISLDLETTAFRPHLGKARLCSINTGKGAYVIDLFETGTYGPVGQAIATHKGVCVGQNIVFDARFLLWDRIELQQVFDTFRASVLLHNGRMGMGHDLYVLMRRELNIAPESLELGGSNWSGPLSKAQLDYAAEDIIHLPALRIALRDKLIKKGLATTATLEFDAIVPEAAVANKGFHLNAEKWTTLAQKQRVREAELREELLRDMPSPRNQCTLPGMVEKWNLASSPQLLESLHRMGVPVDTTDKVQLAMHAADFPLLRKLMEYKGVLRKVTSYGEEYTANIHRPTGRVYCDYYPMLFTGRYAASNPNLSNVPREAAYRDCFEAEEGNTLVISDWSNIEMRIMAEVSANAKMIQLFQEEKDAHYYLASVLSNKPEKDITKPQRQQAKPINFGLIYGMMPPMLILYAQAGYGVTLSLAEAERFHELFFTKAYPGLRQWHRKALNDGQRTGYSRSIGGRIRYLDPEKHHNEFLNNPVQSTGADGLKRALRIVYNRLKKYDGAAYMVHHVHDEIITETRDEPELVAAVEKDVSEGMVEAMAFFLKKVPVVAEPGHGKSWAAKLGWRMPGKKTRTPPILRRCVADVMKKQGADASKAFAICVASLQKSGVLEPNSTRLTAKGKKRQASRVQQPDHKDKMRSYERGLKRSRKTESELVGEALGLPARFRFLLEGGCECESV